MNYMEQVAKQLGVELNEEFDISASGPLTTAEREYLNSIIRPFRNSINYIEKRRGPMAGASWTKAGVPDRTYEYLAISYHDKFMYGKDYNMTFPSYETGEMYVGMEPGREYTLEELGL